jgi:hypothetical protein
MGDRSRCSQWISPSQIRDLAKKWIRYCNTKIHLNGMAWFSCLCGLWLAGGSRGGSVPTYVLGTFYIRLLRMMYTVPTKERISWIFGQTAPAEFCWCTIPNWNESHESSSFGRAIVLFLPRLFCLSRDLWITSMKSTAQHWLLEQFIHI